MNLKKIKKIAAEILNVGVTKIWFDSTALDRLQQCMTKEDVRAAIKEGLIKKKNLNQHSRGRARLLWQKKKKGRKRGPGKRSGTPNARMERKKIWIRNVRAQRKKLKELKEKLKGNIDYSKIYRMIKGGYFRGKKHLESYVLGKKSEGGK